MTEHRKKAARRRAPKRTGRSEVAPVPSDSTPAEAGRGGPVFPDDPRPPRATPDDLDESRAGADQAGIEGLRREGDDPDRAT